MADAGGHAMKTEPGAEDGSTEPLFTRIGAMLVQHALDPTPAHYTLCHRYLSSGETLSGIDIDQLVAHLGQVPVQASDISQAPESESISPEMLQTLADDAAAYLERVTGLIDDNGRAVEDYGDALAGRAESLSASPGNAAALDGLVALTRRMIDRSRDASDHLRRTGAELTTLRTKLVEARHVADSDALTGLPNRRALDIRMTRACHHAQATGQPLTVAICDIDDFKRVNDAHGHQIGDEVIRLVATALETAEAGFVSRYGGEEFVVLFENVALQDAADRIDAIRRALSLRDIRLTATGRRLGRISFSAGVAAIGDCARPSVMLKRADTALYRAKDAGRDRVLVNDDPA